MSDFPCPPEAGDDGASDHLPGRAIPTTALASTHGGRVDLPSLAGRTVLFVFPSPGDAASQGLGDAIAAAPVSQTGGFRDAYAELRGLAISQVYGLSSSPLPDLVETARRLHLPFALLSDEDGALQAALDLPQFERDGALHLRRISLIFEAGRISKVFYPVLAPAGNVEEILAYLREA
ncbi:redoxin family protein [Aurantimonas sp. Leaf443]|uniref:redoxin family protein n=1 Tax=Aurantimonas sp. Leaf443 TaxID=1736378 RepID=UPI0006F64A17|nr:redoxin family protein [Aurantimonas sp. Leaf443]KQT88275.1 hypothetical protein ASG48_02280 [Aurantimonas sp. Leaf443]